MKTGIYKFPYWAVASFPIIAYTIIEGFRYGRGSDYLYYKQLATKLTIENQLAVEPLFYAFNKKIIELQIPYYFAFLFYSFLLIYSCAILLRKRREIAFFALPLFYLATITQSENLVRQFVAFSLILIAINYLLKDKYIIFLVFLISAYFIHHSSIVFLPFLIFFKFIKKPFCNLYVIIILFFISLFVLPKIEIINAFFNKISSLGIYNNYLENNDKWLFGEGIDEIYKDEGANSLVNKFRYIVFPLLIMIFGYQIIDKYKNKGFPLFYNLFIIGVLLRKISMMAATELLYRIDLYFYMFYFIVLAYILYDLNLNYKKINFFQKAVFFYFIIDCSYLLIKTTWIYPPEYGCKFIWDI